MPSLMRIFFNTDSAPIELTRERCWSGEYGFRPDVVGGFSKECKVLSGHLDGHSGRSLLHASIVCLASFAGKNYEAYNNIRYTM